MSSSHGISTQTLLCGHDAQKTMNWPKPNTVPASSAPLKRIRRAIAKQKVPMAATNTFRAAMTASERQKGRT